MIQRVIVSLVVLFGILMLLLPKTDDASVARIASAAMLKCTMDVRGQVARQLLKHESVTRQFENPCPDMIAALDVNTLGELVITGTKHALILTLSPVVDDEQVLWSCIGEPVAFVTPLCKPLAAKVTEQPMAPQEDAITEPATDDAPQQEQQMEPAQSDT